MDAERSVHKNMERTVHKDVECEQEPEMRTIHKDVHIRDLPHWNRKSRHNTIEVTKGGGTNQYSNQNMEGWDTREAIRSGMMR